MSDTQTTPPVTTPAWKSKTVISAVVAVAASVIPPWVEKIAPGTFPLWVMATLQGVASVCGLLTAYFAALRASQGVENLAVQVQAVDDKVAVAQDTADTAVSVTSRMPLG